MSEVVLITLITAGFSAFSGILVALIGSFYQLEIERAKQRQITGLTNPPIPSTGRTKIVLSALIGASVGLFLGICVAFVFIKLIVLTPTSTATSNAPVVLIVTATSPTQPLAIVTATSPLPPTSIVLPTNTLIPPTAVPVPVVILPTALPPTTTPVSVVIPPTAVPVPVVILPTALPPTAVPVPVVILPTALPPTAVPVPVVIPPTALPPTVQQPISCDATPHTMLPQGDHFFPGAIHIAELWRSNKQTPWGDKLVRAIVHGDISVIAAGGSIWTYPSGCEEFVQIDITNNPKAIVISEGEMRSAGLIK